MTTPTREQIVQWAQTCAMDALLWDARQWSYIESFATLARSDLEATSAAQAKQLEEMAETLLKIKIQFEDALLYLKRHIPIPAQFTEALAIQPSPDLLAARDQRVAEAVAEFVIQGALELEELYGSDDLGSLSFGSGVTGERRLDRYNELMELGDDIRSGKWKEYL